MKFAISVLFYILFVIVKRNSGQSCNTNVDCGNHPEIPVEIICCGLNNDQISYPRCCPDILCQSCIDENGQIFEVCDYKCPTN